MTKMGKGFYETFIDDFSKHTKIYLWRNKDKTGEKFLIYKNKVEKNLGRT